MMSDAYRFDISHATDAPTLHGFRRDMLADEALDPAERDELCAAIDRRFAFLNPEHFPQSCSDGLMVLRDSGLLGFWHRFGSVTGFSNLRLRRRPMIGTARQKPKILAAHRHIFSVNAPGQQNFNPRWS
jgi:hypothetical protein